jgi:hypothetical protein
LTRSQFSEEEERKNSLKMKDRRANVYENKGPAFQGLQKSGNVVENKGSYALKPGMLLKTSMLAVGLKPFFSPRSEVAQFGFLVARSTCPGLSWTTKVPRRGTTSLAVGETHGQGSSNKIAYDREGVKPLLYQLGAKPDSTPSGLVNRRGASFPWVSPTANDIGPLRGPP